MARLMRMHERLRSFVGRQVLPPLMLRYFLEDPFLMRRRRKVATPILRKTSGSSKLQRPRLGDLHKVWSFLDLNAQLRSRPLPVPSQFFVAGIASHIGRAIWPISPIDHLVMMTLS